MPDITGSELKVHSDWHANDERYVRRGELLASMNWLASWRSELGAMNSGKRGRPYRFPRSLIRYVRLQRDVWHLSLREAQGALRALGTALGFEAPDFTTLWKRLTREEEEPVVPPGAREHILAIDSTGIKLGDRGEWLRHKWKLRRGFIKVHVAIDVGTMTVAAVIKLRKDAIVRLEGSQARNLAVVEREALGEDGWKARYEYWLRWKVEVVFSAIKRVLGESLRSIRSDLMLREAQHKFIAYNRLAMA